MPGAKKNLRAGKSRRAYTLPCPHTHAGELHDPGTELDLWPDQIERIESVAAESQPEPDEKPSGKGGDKKARPDKGKPDEQFIETRAEAGAEFNPGGNP